MKTPEEIKKGLECCRLGKPCVDCSYDRRDFPHCVERLMEDAVYIINQYEQCLAHAQRERAALMVDFLNVVDGAGSCDVCARADEGYTPLPPHCKYASEDDCFVWRGVCEENSKEENNG